MTAPKKKIIDETKGPARGAKRLGKPSGIHLESVDLPPARAVDPESFAQQIANLQVGETAARAQRFAAESTTYPEITEVKGKLRNVTNGQLAKVKAKPKCEGHQYTTAIGHFNAADGDTLVVVTITRVA